MWYDLYDFKCEKKNGSKRKVSLWEYWVIPWTENLSNEQNFNIEKTYTQNETETTEISRADNVKGRIVKLNTYNEYRW